jgi:16S rRNA processing protein RimM
VTRRTQHTRDAAPRSSRGAPKRREPGIQHDAQSSRLDSGSGADAPSRNDRVLVARFGAAHGVRGEIKLWSFTSDPLAVADYGPLETKDDKQQFVIDSLRPAKDFLVARIQGVDDRNAAELLRNVELYVPRERLPAIDEDDTWYYADLVGLAAVAPDGAAVGFVTAVHNFGAGDVIEIAPAGGGKTLLLPFTETVVPEVDIKAGRIVLVMPEEEEDIPPLKGEGGGPPAR